MVVLVNNASFEFGIQKFLSMETQTILFLAAGYKPSFQIDRTDLVENTHRLQRWSQPFEDQIKYVMLIDIVFQLW